MLDVIIILSNMQLYKIYCDMNSLNIIITVNTKYSVDIILFLRYIRICFSTIKA